VWWRTLLESHRTATQAGRAAGKAMAEAQARRADGKAAAEMIGPRGSAAPHKRHIHPV